MQDFAALPQVALKTSHNREYTTVKFSVMYIFRTCPSANFRLCTVSISHNWKFAAGVVLKLCTIEKTTPVRPVFNDGTSHNRKNAAKLSYEISHDRKFAAGVVLKLCTTEKTAPVRPVFNDGTSHDRKNAARLSYETSHNRLFSAGMAYGFSQFPANMENVRSYKQGYRIKPGFYKMADRPSK